jgi:hypothetical protein
MSFSDFLVSVLNHTQILFAVYLVAGIVVMWTLLILATNLWYAKSTKSWIFRGLITHAVPYTSIDMASRAAAERSEHLLRFLREYSDRGGVKIEFIEQPPGFPELRLKEFVNQEPAAFWHSSRLTLQLDSMKTLLLERVTDALICLRRADSLSASEFPSCVSLERISRPKGRGEFPWRVVITCKNPETLTSWLSKDEVQIWLGIGVDLVSPRTGRRARFRGERPSPGSPSVPVSQGRCLVNGDVEGQVGGVIEGARIGEPLAVTCRHVLSPTCGSLYWPRPLFPPSMGYSEDSPDAAFLGIRSGCFVHLPPRLGFVGVASLEDVYDAIKTKSRLLRKNPDRDGTRARPQAMVSLVRLGDYEYRGPHLHVEPYFYRFLGVIWPRSRRFSVSGDSGAWVIEEVTNKWVGMVVGGFEEANTPTYVVLGCHILEAFRQIEGLRCIVPKMLVRGN